MKYETNGVFAIHSFSNTVSVMFIYRQNTLMVHSKSSFGGNIREIKLTDSKSASYTSYTNSKSMPGSSIELYSLFLLLWKNNQMTV